MIKNAPNSSRQLSVVLDEPTPDCNTGVGNASERDDAIEPTPTQGPVSQALVDYLRFTVHPSEDGETESQIVQRYMNLLGGDEPWDIRPYGLYRYRKSARLEGCYIAWGRVLKTRECNPCDLGSVLE